jgi:hypothetical protein
MDDAPPIIDAPIILQSNDEATHETFDVCSSRSSSWARGGGNDSSSSSSSSAASGASDDDDDDDDGDDNDDDTSSSSSACSDDEAADSMGNLPDFGATADSGPSPLELEHIRTRRGGDGRRSSITPVTDVGAAIQNNRP